MYRPDNFLILHFDSTFYVISFPRASNPTTNISNSSFVVVENLTDFHQLSIYSSWSNNQLPYCSIYSRFYFAPEVPPKGLVDDVFFSLRTSLYIYIVVFVLMPCDELSVRGYFQSRLNQFLFSYALSRSLSFSVGRNLFVRQKENTRKRNT